MALINHKFLLAARPVGMPKRSDWTFIEEPVGEPKEGELLVRVLYISLDPAMRMWINEARSYIPPVGIGELMRALGVGIVTASRNPAFAVGDHVSGAFGVQEYALTNGQAVRKIDAKIAPLPKYLSVLGMPGMTAYFGLLDTGQPKPGDTVVVSAAAGAVGSLVGQIAKIKNCRVVGIAGGAEKCRYIVHELGFDAAIDYKSEDVRQSLRKHCPEGINVYFDNVGGTILEAALSNLARGARIVICGAISQYNNTGPGPRAQQLHVSADESREHEGHAGNRLRRSLRTGRSGNGGMDGSGQTEVARAHCRRTRHLSRNSAQAFQE